MARKTKRPYYGGGRQKGTGSLTTRLMIQLPPEMKTRLDAQAAVAKKSLAAFCRDAIERALAARG